VGDPDVKRWIIVCAVVEGGAWLVAWLTGWSMPAVVVAIGATLGVTGVIFTLQRRRQR
jgi:hypothetical protein